MFPLTGVMFYELRSDPLEAMHFQYHQDPHSWNQLLDRWLLAHSAHGSSVQLTPLLPRSLMSSFWGMRLSWLKQCLGTQRLRSIQRSHPGRQAGRPRIHSIQKRHRLSFTVWSSSLSIHFSNYQAGVRKWACFARPKFKYSFKKNGLEKKSVFHSESTHRRAKSLTVNSH